MQEATRPLVSEELAAGPVKAMQAMETTLRRQESRTLAWKEVWPRINRVCRAAQPAMERLLVGARSIFR